MNSKRLKMKKVASQNAVFLKKRLHIWRASLLIFGLSYFVRTLVKCTTCSFEQTPSCNHKKLKVSKTLSAQAQKFGILMKKRLHWASVVRDSTHQKKYPRKLFAKIRKILLFFSYFYPLKVFKNTFNNFSPLKLSWQLLTSNWQLSCFSSRSFLYIRFLPCDSIIRQKRATCHTEPVVIMYTRQKFSTPALSRHLSWTHNGVK